jgi:hypothetical protein
MKRVVSVSLGSRSRDYAITVELLGQRISIERVGTNGDVAQAKRLYAALDGVVDCLGVGGATLAVESQRRSYRLTAPWRMVAHVRQTPVVDGSGFRNVMERRVADYVLEELGDIFAERTVFSLVAADRMALTLGFADNGFEVVMGDVMFALGLPVALKGLDAHEKFMTWLAPLVRHLPMSMLYPTGEREDVNTPRYVRWFEWAEVIAGDGNYATHYMPLDMRGKLVATNTTTARDVRLYRERGVRYLVTSTPRLGERSFGTNLMEATLVALSGKERKLDTAEVVGLIDELGWCPNLERLQE